MRTEDIISIVLLIIGAFFLVMGYPLMKILEKQESRWSNMALALCIIVGLGCIGIFAII